MYYPVLYDGKAAVILEKINLPLQTKKVHELEKARIVELEGKIEIYQPLSQKWVPVLYLKGKKVQTFEQLLKRSRELEAKKKIMYGKGFLREIYRLELEAELASDIFGEPIKSISYPVYDKMGLGRRKSTFLEDII